jgi:hypothetical protein
MVLALAALLTAASARAQSAPASQPGPYVIDIRGAMSGLPSSTDFHPALPASALVPKRGFGPAVGAHLYPKRLGAARIGFGVEVVRARGTVATAAPSSSTTTTTTTTTTGATATTTSVLSANAPISVATTLTVIAPQVSFNFGTRDGWSYLSGGYGLAQVHSAATGTVLAPLTGTSILTRDDGRTAAINYGGGARWFIRDRLGVGFDVRFHRIAALGTRSPAKMVIASVGVSLR